MGPLTDGNERIPAVGEDVGERRQRGFSFSDSFSGRVKQDSRVEEAEVGGWR